MSELVIFEKLRDVLEEKAALKIAQAITEAVSFYEKIVTKDEFIELKIIVKDLLEAQKRAEERLTALEEKMAELAEAQRKTEQRLSVLEEKMAELAEAQKKTEQRVNELAEAQKRTEQRVNELAEAQRKTEQRVNELAEAQKRTEQRVNELAEAQRKTEQRVNELAEAQRKTEQRLSVLEEKMAELAEAQRKTEQRVNELAEAQKRTEESLNKLIGVVEDLKEQVGGHSHTIGHILEDKAIVKLPKILKDRYGIEIEGKLKRGYLENDREEMEEINVFGFGKKDGQRILILGEGKSRFSKNDLKDLQKKVSRFKKRYEVFPVIITYIFSSYKVEEEVKEKGIAYFLSFEFEE